jgi:hypothetical protein
MGSEWEIVNLGGCAVDVREYPQIGGEFRQQIFLTRSREAAKNAKEKAFHDFSAPSLEENSSATKFRLLRVLRVLRVRNAFAPKLRRPSRSENL